MCVKGYRGIYSFYGQANRYDLISNVMGNVAVRWTFEQCLVDYKYT